MLKEIIGFPDYKIDTVGNIFSFKYAAPRMLKPWINTWGYYAIKLCVDNKVKHVRVHRLVAITYLDNYSEELDVNHIDGNKLNNSVDNLEMCTRRQNCQHAFDIGLNKRGSNHHAAKLTEEQVGEIKGILDEKVNQTRLAEKYGVSPQTICDIKNGRGWRGVL